MLLPDQIQLDRGGFGRDLDEAQVERLSRGRKAAGRERGRGQEPERKELGHDVLPEQLPGKSEDERQERRKCSEEQPGNTQPRTPPGGSEGETGGERQQACQEEEEPERFHIGTPGEHERGQGHEQSAMEAADRREEVSNGNPDWTPSEQPFNPIRQRGSGGASGLGGLICLDWICWRFVLLDLEDPAVRREQIEDRNRPFERFLVLREQRQPSLRQRRVDRSARGQPLIERLAELDGAVVEDRALHRNHRRQACADERRSHSGQRVLRNTPGLASIEHRQTHVGVPKTFGQHVPRSWNGGVVRAFEKEHTFASLCVEVTVPNPMDDVRRGVEESCTQAFQCRVLQVLDLEGLAGQGRGDRRLFALDIERPVGQCSHDDEDAQRKGDGQWGAGFGAFESSRQQPATVASLQKALQLVVVEQLPGKPPQLGHQRILEVEPELEAQPAIAVDSPAPRLVQDVSQAVRKQRLKKPTAQFLGSMDLQAFAIQVAPDAGCRGGTLPEERRRLLGREPERAASSSLKAGARKKNLETAGLLGSKLSCEGLVVHGSRPIWRRHGDASLC